MMTDPIADMLTRIRNANSIYRSQVDVPYSKIKQSMLEKLRSEGFIKDYKIEEKSPQNVLTVYLKYGTNGEKVIREIKRVSKPGRRLYQQTKKMRLILNGLGVLILSTSKGILTDRECREQKVGGEILCMIW